MKDSRWVWGGVPFVKEKKLRPAGGWTGIHCAAILEPTDCETIQRATARLAPCWLRTILITILIITRFIVLFFSLRTPIFPSLDVENDMEGDPRGDGGAANILFRPLGQRRSRFVAGAREDVSAHALTRQACLQATWIP